MVPEAKPPSPLVTNHSRLSAASRSWQVSGSMCSATPVLLGRDGEESLDIFGPAVERGLEVGERHSTRDQPLEDAGPSLLRLLEVLHPKLEISAVRVDGPEGHAVAEHHLQVDNVGWNLDLAITAGQARQADHAVCAQLGHRVKGDGAVAGGLQDVIDLAEFCFDPGNRVIIDALVAGTELRDDLRLQASRRRLRVHVHLEASQP